MRIDGFMFRVLSLLCVAVNAWGLWPDCEVRSGEYGGPAILIDGKPQSPIFFCGNNQFGRDDVLIEELGRARDAGLELFSFGISVNDSAEKVAETVDRFASVHPEGYYYIRLWLGAPKDWCEAHPDECIAGPDGETIPWASPASEAWRDWATDRLRDHLDNITDGPHGDRFIGVLLSNLNTAEWFYPETNEYWDYSPANLAAFREWLKDTYTWNRRLQAAWGDESVTFENAEIPAPDEREAAYWGPFRHPVRHRAAMDYSRFTSDLIVDAIAHFAENVKGVTRRRSLVGVFYGYTFELNHNGPRALAHSGHLAFGKLLELKNIDLIHAPFSYLERAPGEPGHVHLPLDSAPLHNKLVVLEDDTYTHLATPPKPGLAAPGWDARPQDLEGSVALMHRNFGQAFAHRAGIWFFDLLSDGRWNDEGFWVTTGLLRRAAAEVRTYPHYEPEVAVIVDEASVHLMPDTTWPYLLESLGKWRSSFARLGTTVGYYLQSDAEEIPESVKMLIFLNAYQAHEDAEAAAEAVVERGGVVVWTHAAGLYGTDGADVAGIRGLTGFEVDAHFDAGPASLESAVDDETVSFGDAPWNPRLVIKDDDVTPLARYADTGELSAALRKEGDGVVVYTATPGLPADILRHIATAAGVSEYVQPATGFSVLPPYLIVHGLEQGAHRFQWPVGPIRAEQVYPPRRGYAVRDGRAWEAVLGAGETQIYRIEGPMPSTNKEESRAYNFSGQRD